MRIRPGAAPSEWRLSQDGQEIGYVRGSQVGVIGFRSQMDAAQAAYAAHRALVRRRSESMWTTRAPDAFLLGERGDAQYVIARDGLLAQLLPPERRAGRTDWGFEVTLRPEERASVFAMSRARTVWNALRRSGFARLMRQFSTKVAADATVDSHVS